MEIIFLEKLKLRRNKFELKIGKIYELIDLFFRFKSCRTIV